MFERSSYTKEDFIEAVKNSISIASALSKLKIKPTGGNYRLFQQRARVLDLDLSHFKGRGYLKGKTHDWNVVRDFEDVLVENSDYSNTVSLKRRLLKAELLKKHCYNCGLTNWLDKPLALHLDHINGTNNDHRIENLRLLCPNCHSQTDTYAGKNKKIKTSTKKRSKKPPRICKCGTNLSKKAKQCINCFNQPKKIEWPAVEQLQTMVSESNYSAVARKLGVSDNAIRKHLVSHGTTTPSRTETGVSQPASKAGAETNLAIVA